MTNQTLIYIVIAVIVALVIAFLFIRSKKKAKADQQGQDNTQVYVGNLPYRVRESDLKRHFSQYGQIEQARVVKNRTTNRSMGFGFVTFSNSNEANLALKANGEELQGRAMVVRIAKPR